MSDDLESIQAIFFEECEEGLIAAEAGLNQMAGGNTSPDVIAAVFRAVHSIKGGSGAFGFMNLMGFSHKFENLLDEVRGGRIPVTPECMRVMLMAFDVLTDHVGAALGRNSLPDDTAAGEALEHVLETGGAPVAAAPIAAPVAAPVVAAPVVAAPPPPAAGDEMGFVPVSVDLPDLDGLPDLDALPPLDSAPVAAAPASPRWRVRYAPSRMALANGGEPLLVVRELETFGGEVLSVDSSALPDLHSLDPEDSYFVYDIAIPADVPEQQIRDCFEFADTSTIVEIRREGGPPDDPELAAPTAPQAAVAAPAKLVSLGDRAPAPPRVVEAKPTENNSQTIRIDLAKLDLLLNLVGELVIRNSILSDRLSPADQERVELPELARLTREIQDNVMSLRAQPIRQAFSRVPRMLRDLCAETGKQVLLDTSGETTEVDKGVIEKIGEPLTHLIRNAVDHGIESVADRIAAGKPAEGLIRLSAEQKGARIFVSISDDGRGIDRVRVRAKAIERGIIEPDANLSDEEIDQLICAPGFSTADTISNISGRGVGMDVVRSNVEALGGRVDITSVPGRGTTFTLALPLTLAILDGMIVRLAGQRFVLPLANVVEAVQPEASQVRPISPTSETIELRGSYLPVRRLTDFFGLAANDEAAEGRRTPEESLVVIVESDSSGRMGLMVDTIEDRREVVIKSLDQNLYPIRGLGGATILGDGSIALILDVDALMTNATPRYSNQGLAA
jgi:two-component system, chemotaxis family, sensor kinase CheA